MSRSDRAPKKWYREYNQRYWQGELPDDVIVRWGRDDEDDVDWDEKDKNLQGDTDTAARPMEVRLSPHFRRMKWYGTAKFTLHHEMVHVAHAHRKIELEDEHGEAFESEMRRLALAGAFQKQKGQGCLW